MLLLGRRAVAHVARRGVRRLNPDSGIVDMQFRDMAQIVVSGGRGGQGCISWVRLRNGKRGRANGGNGGRGGDVIIRASSSMMGLSLPSHHIKGQNGANGGPDLSHGKRGKDTVLLVPLGTMLRSMDEPDDDDQWMDMFDGDVDPGADDVEEVGNGVGGSEDADGDEGSDVVHAAGAGGNDGLVDEVDSSGNNDALDDVEGVTDEKKREFNVICDLVENGQQVTVAEGGMGGMGNRSGNLRFVKGITQIPEHGKKGTRSRIELELKTLADVGLVGLPNAGKSSLLKALSNARPKIASYPFTTLQPNLCVLDFDDREMTRVTIADIPGLIEGASENRGLGHKFLRHIERTKVLIYVLDMAETDGRDPIDDFQCLRQELLAYNEEMVRRPSVIFANKVDSMPNTAAANVARLTNLATGIPIVVGSAMRGQNLDALVQTLHTLVPKAPLWSKRAPTE
ncbi:OBG-type G domain-containing protein [Plasmodiophora brassicae]|uniref:OBG-type G domain-containing protein n=1 Tax=Plasmodiophora brassicae TaxID=37360 RepID=A0A3P3YJF3_PLABS|nr:unnamed protein product [Plasmodiophora brassicae]